MFRTPAIICLFLSILLHAFVGYKLTTHRAEPKHKEPEPVVVNLVHEEPPPPPPPPPPPEVRPETPPPPKPKPKPPVTPPDNPITVPPQPDSPDVPFEMGTDLTPDPTPPPPAENTGPVYLKARLSASEKMKQPKYPQSALRDGIEGEVSLRLRIAANGEVLDVEMIKGSRNRDLDQAARRHAKSLKFEPATEGGSAVESMLDLIIAFKIGGASSLNLD